MEDTNPLGKIETQGCSRCGGSGNYSYCQTWGTKCFKCVGKGRVYTARGLATSLYLKALRSKPASQVVAGDGILHEDVMSGTRRFVKITNTSIRENGWSELNGVRTPTILCYLEWEGHSLGLRPDTPVRIAQTAEQKMATFKRALEYQAALTKKGIPRK